MLARTEGQDLSHVAGGNVNNTDALNMVWQAFCFNQSKHALKLPLLKIP